MIDTSSSATLTVSRRARFVGSDAAFRVIVDGHERDRLRPGEGVTSDVTPGTHEVHVTTDGRVRSPSVTIDIPPGGEGRIFTSSPANPVANLLRIIFRPAQTLEIEEL